MDISFMSSYWVTLHFKGHDKNKNNYAKLDVLIPPQSETMACQT